VKANVIGSVPAGEDPELFCGGLPFAGARSRLGCSLRDRNDFPGFAHVDMLGGWEPGQSSHTRFSGGAWNRYSGRLLFCGDRGMDGVAAQDGG
jgi:hypothetical protein